MFQKHAANIKDDIEILTDDLGKTNINSSRLEKAVEKSFDIAQNISGIWVTAGFENKRALQSLVIPVGIKYNKEKGTVRTERVNRLFAAIPPMIEVLSEKKKGNLYEDYLSLI